MILIKENRKNVSQRYFAHHKSYTTDLGPSRRKRRLTALAPTPVVYVLSSFHLMTEVEPTSETLRFW